MAIRSSDNGIAQTKMGNFALWYLNLQLRSARPGRFPPYLHTMSTGDTLITIREEAASSA